MFPVATDTNGRRSREQHRDLDNVMAPLSIHCKKMLNELSHFRGPLQLSIPPEGALMATNMS